MRHLRGFTLVELLVVISIIAVLIAMLMPSLGSARDSGMHAVCLSAKRQMMIGYTSFSTDYNGRLMVGVPSNNAEAFVRPGNTKDAIRNGALYEYVEDIEVYQCPEDPYGNHRSYSIVGVLRGEGWTGTGQLGTDKITDVVSPEAQMVFIEESDHRGWNVGSWLMRVQNGTQGRFVDYVSLFHYQGIADNISFLDGHVETKIWDDPDTIRANKNKQFFLNDPGNVDWDWLRPRYRQLREEGDIPYLTATN